MVYWLNETLAALPAFLLVFLGMGIPWALALIPRADWSDRLQVMAVALLTAPALLTAWLFILGTLGALEWDAAVSGIVVLIAIGCALAWRKRRGAATGTRSSWLADEVLIVALIIAALIVRAWVIGWWPFTAYDALWVYGYQGRLYTLLGALPDSIGYYPPFMSLQYTFGQLAVGQINDHAARAGLLLLHLGSVLATYTLGAKLFNRRVGIIAAGIWVLYPHVGDWSRAGDLEIPLASAFTLASAFFLLAWTQTRPHRVYAALAGLILGIGLWIKPTMGAFVLGVGLMLLIDLVRVRFDWRAWRPRLEIALITGLASAPLGGVWYIRNLLLGHSPVDFPPGYWQMLAARSGAEFGWVLLALGAAFAYALLKRGMPRPTLLAWGGLALTLAGVLPSIIQPARMGVLEWLALGSGSAILVWTFWQRCWVRLNEMVRHDIAMLGWTWALGLPYFVVWFVAYSYHYRLSFAIVPLLLLPTAVLIANWLRPPRALALRAVYLASIALIGLPGVVSGVYDPYIGWDYLWSDAYPDDDSRYRTGNAALMSVVDGLRVWKADNPDETLRVFAPGVDRLPFFFPLDDIRTTDAPTRLDDLSSAAYFVYGLPETRGEYESVPFFENQVIGALGRTDIMRRAWGLDDGIFRYDVYELNLENRFVTPAPNGAAPEDVVFGGFARYLGYDIAGLEFWEGRRLVFKLYWQVIAPAPEDYSIMVHLRDGQDNLIAAWDAPAAPSEVGYYSTLFWQPGEYIVDERWLRLPDGVLPVGGGYRLIIGMYPASDGMRIPVSVDGAPHGDEYEIENRMAILASPP
jgi:hypothetical protein